MTNNNRVIAVPSRVIIAPEVLFQLCMERAQKLVKEYRGQIPAGMEFLNAFTGSFLCTSFKQEILSGIHLAAHSYKIALYTSSASLTAATTAYTATGEVANGNGYTTTGQALTGFTTSSSGTTAWMDWTSDPAWPAATFTARGALIYNDTLAGKNAVAVLDFGSDKTATNGTFTVQLPTADATNAIVRIA